jgi:hypothetical protein
VRSRVGFRWFDPDDDPAARQIAVDAAGGNTSTPIVLFPDGSILVDPDVLTAAAGEGAMATALVHQYLGETNGASERQRQEARASRG